jgi:hypothetical protein
MKPQEFVFSTRRTGREVEPKETKEPEKEGTDTDYFCPSPFFAFFRFFRL